MRYVGRIHKFSPGANRGYMPLDLPQHRPPNRIKPWWKVLGKPRVFVPAFEPLEGFSDKPEYPPLERLGTRSDIKPQIRLDWYNKIRGSPTVEEKMFETLHHTSHYVAHINNWLLPYNSLPVAQWITKTNCVNSLPSQYDDASNIDVALVDRVKKLVLQQILIDRYESIKKPPIFVSNSIRSPNRSQQVSNQFVQNVMNSVARAVSLENDQIDQYHKDLSPSLRSWWYHSGLEPPNGKVFYRSRKDEDGCINQMIQVDGSASLAYRSKNSLEPIVSETDPLVTDTSAIQRLQNNLKGAGGVYKFKRPVTMPGFWYNSNSVDYDFPHTCFLNMDCLSHRDRKSSRPMTLVPDDFENCLNTQSILTSFAWLNGLSQMHGFTTFDELTYPLTCQTITTNGQDWVFNVYQMNSHAFHRDLTHDRKNNVCWSSGLMKLYEDYSDGQFHGINEDVIRLLTRFFATRSSEGYTSQLDLRPYLGNDTRTAEEKEEQARRLENYIYQRKNKYLSAKFQVPIFEHIYFRAPVNRHRVTYMKPEWHIPKPKYPDIFE